MIVTIDDYRSTALSNTNNSNEPLKEDDCQFTVAGAGRLKLKLQALNNALTRTPLDQHPQLPFDDIVKGSSCRTYVDGSEEVYFMLKNIPGPNNIPDVFVKAYYEVLRLRPYTNAYVVKQYYEPRAHDTINGRFTPTFSELRPMLLGLDTICDTTLHRFFQDAEERVHSFPFLKLPTELRLQVYDYLVPYHSAYIPMDSRKFPRYDGSKPERLDILRVCKTIHDEVMKQSFDQRVLLFRACRTSRKLNPEGCFTTETTEEYARRITSINPEVRRRLTRLEIRILPTREERQQALRDSLSLADNISLRHICNSLPNLESILFSYERPDPKVLHQVRILWGMPIYAAKPSYNYAYNHNMKVTLEWIREQLWLPVGGPRMLWDLTYFREPGGDSKQLGKDILEERMMRELIEEHGSLGLVLSATATQEDLQRWSEVKEGIHKATKQG